MKDEALKLALEALEELNNTNSYWWQEVADATVAKIDPAISAIKEALAQPEQEPVAFLVDGDLYYPEEIDWETLQEQGHTVASLYTSPPQPALEQNFCPRCGKRTQDIHTCTPPPQEENT